VKATPDHFEAVGEAIVRDAKGFGHNTFKIVLAKRAIVRALQHATRMEPKA
jgi:xanthine dehydrogenase YagS FAD-binding subunit